MEQITDLKSCNNCGSALPEDATYCPHCGQRYTDGKIPLKVLLLDFIDNFFNFDSKLFRTLGHLFIPGKLTVEFFRGRQKAYISPFRLLLLTIVLFVAALSVVVKKNSNKIEGFAADWEKNQVIHDLVADADTIRQTVVDSFNNRNSTKAVNYFYAQLGKLDTRYSDSARVTRIVLFNDKFERRADSILLETIKKQNYYLIAKEDLLNKSDKELVEAYVGAASVIEKILFRQSIRIYKSPQNIPQYAISKISWLVLISLPIFAVVLKLFYLRKKRYYVEHLILNVHIHTLLFLLVFLILFVQVVLPSWMDYEPRSLGWMIALTSIYGLAYIPLSMKRYYGERWWVTILKFIGSSAFYWITLAISATFTAIIGLLLY